VSLVLYLKRNEAGSVVIADRAIQCDQPGCGVLRNVSEFVTHYETMQFLPEWQYFRGEHRCPDHWQDDE
jgi:hypothetical protein